MGVKFIAGSFSKLHNLFDMDTTMVFAEGKVFLPELKTKSYLTVTPDKDASPFYRNLELKADGIYF